MSLSREELAELEAKHGRIAHVVGAPRVSFADQVAAEKSEAAGDKVRAKELATPKPTWEVVLRCPRRAEYKQFRAKVHNPVQKADAQETLARQCCVFPPAMALDALLEDFPGIAEACDHALQELTGMATDESGK